MPLTLAHTPRYETECIGPSLRLHGPAGFAVLAVGQLISSMQCCSGRAAVQDLEDPGQGLAANQARFEMVQIKHTTAVPRTNLVLDTVIAKGSSCFTSPWRECYCDAEHEIGHCRVLARRTLAAKQLSLLAKTAVTSDRA